MLRKRTARQLWLTGDYGGALAAWLNSDFDSEAEARCEVAQTIRKMNDVIGDFREVYELWLRTPTDWTEDEFTLVAEEISSPWLFRKVVPLIKPSPDPRRVGRWELRWMYSGGIRMSFYEAGQIFLFGMDVSKAIRCLVQLGEQGLLNRMRECPKCGKWLYATFRHQKFCSTKCQQASYRSSEQWKAHRAVWMRDYRRKIALPNVLTRGEREGMKQREQESRKASAKAQG
jgi:hypothetical protein